MGLYIEGIYINVEKFCCTCSYLEPDKESNGKFRCEKLYDYVLASAPNCHRYLKAYSRSDDEVRQIYSHSKGKYEGCFITTIVCMIKGYNDQCKYLNELRKFRKILNTNDEGRRLLAEYDIVGPIISDNLEHLYKTNKGKCMQLANKFFIESIYPIYTMLNVKNISSLTEPIKFNNIVIGHDVNINYYIEAIKYYYNGVTYLKKIFNINTSDYENEIYSQKIKSLNLGHGKR